MRTTYNLHEGQTTPASIECKQEPTLLIPSVCLQLRREDSVPLHLTLLRSIGPVPCPKAAR